LTHGLYQFIDCEDYNHLGHVPQHHDIYGILFNCKAFFYCL